MGVMHTCPQFIDGFEQDKLYLFVGGGGNESQRGLRIPHFPSLIEAPN